MCINSSLTIFLGRGIMDIITSVTTEIALWDLFQSTRGANTTAFLSGIIAIWVAARFSSVSVDIPQRELHAHS